MVFVTLGTPTQGFARLVRAIDSLVGQGFFGVERVFAQTGSTRGFQPQHCDWKPFLSRGEFEACLKEASLVISHGGSTLLDLARLGKVPVAMPRRRKYGEHINDHQLETVKALAAEGWVVPAYEAGDLPGAIDEARRRTARRVPAAQMVALVREAIEELMAVHGR